jgi:hypothetical protein
VSPSFARPGVAAGPFVPFTIRRAGPKKAGMMTTAQPWPLAPFRPQAAVPVRSPRTSLILAELARQRRHERRQRREARVRRAAWFALFDRRPFELVRTQAAPEVVFAGAMPLVYTLPWT